VLAKGGGMEAQSRFIISEFVLGCCIDCTSLNLKANNIP